MQERRLNGTKKTMQNYAEWDADGGTYKIWLEDEQSLEEKLKVIKSNNLAGVAEWSLGMEGLWCVGSDSSVCKLIRHLRKRHPLSAYILIYVGKGMILCEGE